MRFTLRHTTLVAACMATFPAFATNGYFLPGFGIRSQGMGGVGIAYGRDSLSTAANPANAVNSGMRGDMGFGVFNPERNARLYEDPTTPGAALFPGESESDAKYFLVPEMGMSMPLSERLHIAFAVVGNGGMNTTYRENFYPTFGPGTRRDDTLGVDMMQLLAPLTLAYKVNENHAIGASLVMGITRLEMRGIQVFGQFNISGDPAHLTDQGHDYSYGAGVKLGWQGEFLEDKLTVGLAYQSRTFMTKFDKYRGLFAEHGGFDIPESYGIGLALKPRKNLVIAADILRINYNDVATIGNPGPTTDPDGFGPKSGIQALDNGGGCVPVVTVNCLGEDQGMGFGWQNMTVYKLGMQWGVNDRLLLRAGFNYGKSPIPDGPTNSQVTFNSLAPATVERHYSVGFTYRASDLLEVTGTYMYVPTNSQTTCGQNIIDCATISMHQNVFGLSLSWVLEPSAAALEEYGEAKWDGINFDNWYAGFGFGQSRYRDLGVSTANTRTEGWKVYSGYQFNKYLGLEGGYANLNDMTATNGATRAEVESNAWALAAVGSYPLTDKFAVMAKLGAAYVQTNASVRVGTALAQRSGDDSYQPYYGVGVKYALLDNVDLRAEWERFDLDDYNIDLMTAGFAVKF